MDRILFGDNQFFGVNHLSDQKAREKENLPVKKLEMLIIRKFPGQLGKK